MTALGRIMVAASCVGDPHAREQRHRRPLRCPCRVAGESRLLAAMGTTAIQNQALAVVRVNQRTAERPYTGLTTISHVATTSGTVLISPQVSQRRDSAR